MYNGCLHVLCVFLPEGWPAGTVVGQLKPLAYLWAGLGFSVWSFVLS